MKIHLCNPAETFIQSGTMSLNFFTENTCNLVSSEYGCTEWLNRHRIDDFIQPSS